VAVIGAGPTGQLVVAAARAARIITTGLRDLCV
jgi:threonine dehydrogenase-like Zn-dependent dehydrogenase